MFRAAMLAALALGGCGKRTIDADKAAALLDRVTLDTGGANGLSGLAVDGDGALWTVAERDAVGFRIELDGAKVRSITRVPVVGVPRGNDLESIGYLGGDRFWVGTEGKDHGVARIYSLRHQDGALKVVEARELTQLDAELEIGANHGGEGLCIAREQVIVAMETASKPPGRWAPVVTVDAADRRVLHRVRLTTDTGKLSALDCWPLTDAGDGGDDGAAIQVIAIERHFEVTRVIGFRLPSVDGWVTPASSYDLSPVLRGALNLEGLARLPDGRLVAVVDNQYGKITGPNELLIFKAPLAARPTAPAR